VGKEAIAAFVALLSRREQEDIERRRHPRVPYTECIRIQGASETDALVGFARDISRGGIAFVTTKPLTLGFKHLILPQKKDGSPLHVRARILRCTRIMDGFYDVGAEFLDSSDV
jgi:hypothetical protein